MPSRLNNPLSAQSWTTGHSFVEQFRQPCLCSCNRIQIVAHYLVWGRQMSGEKGRWRLKVRFTFSELPDPIWPSLPTSRLLENEVPAEHEVEKQQPYGS
jgi:hypothetical protein